jgi:hypothetical protein
LARHARVIKVIGIEKGYVSMKTHLMAVV